MQGSRRHWLRPAITFCFGFEFRLSPKQLSFRQPEAWPEVTSNYFNRPPLDRWRKLVRRNVILVHPSSFAWQWPAPWQRPWHRSANAQTGSPAQTSPTPAAAPHPQTHRPSRGASARWTSAGSSMAITATTPTAPAPTANGKVNDLYNFNDKTNQFNLSAAKLTLNHDPGLLGARMDFFYGRTSHLINTPSSWSSLSRPISAPSRRR